MGKIADGEEAREFDIFRLKSYSIVHGEGVIAPQMCSEGLEGGGAFLGASGRVDDVQGVICEARPKEVVDQP